MATGLKHDVLLNDLPFSEWPESVQNYYRAMYGDGVGERIDNGERLVF